MKLKFRSISEIFKNNSLGKVLRSFLGKARFSALKLSSNDQREWLDSAQVLAGKTRIEFLDLVAGKLKMTAMQVVPKSTTMEDDLKNRCEQAGCCLLRKDGVLLGIVTCAPELTLKIMPEYAGIPRYISYWNQIRQSLITAAAGKAYDPFENLFDIIQSYGTTRLEICSLKGIYEITTNEGKKASGKIAHDSIETIFTVTEDKINKIDQCITYQDQQYKVSKNGSSTIFEKVNILNSQFPDLNILDVKLQTEEYKALENKTQSKKPGTLKAEKDGYVLIIDDNQSFTSVVSKYFKGQNIKSVVINNGQDAVSYLDSKKSPLVIICDLHMPKKNGFDVVRHVRNSVHLEQIPIIMLTSDQDVEAEIAFLELGVNAFLKKNQDPRLLSTHVKRLMNQENNLANAA